MEEKNGTEKMKALGITSWAFVGLIVLLGIALYALFSIQAVLMPFFYALIFVYVLRPVVDYLDDRGLPRVVALLVSFIGLFLALALLGMYIGPIFFKEGNSLINKLPDYVSVANGYVTDYINTHPFLKGEQVTDILKGFEKSFKAFLEDLALAIPQITASFFGSIINFILAPIIAFYILKDLTAIRTTASEMIPAKHRVEGMQILRKIDCIVGGFLMGQALVALSVAILSATALSILGLDYAILLGFLIGLFNIIPYLGPIIGGAPAVIVALGTSWQLAVIVVAVLLVVQQLDSLLISPRIMSQQVNLHPTVVMFALLAGGTILGIMGMLIAIPIAAVGKALYLHFRERNSIEEPVAPDFNELKPEAKV